MKSSIVALTLMLLAQMQPVAATSQNFGRLNEDMSVKLTLLETLRSGRAQKGQRVLFEVSDPVEDQNGNILIRKGAKAFGEVEDSRSAGIMGRRGILNIKIQHTTAVDGNRVALRATQSKEGSGNKGLITAGFWLVAWPLAFLRGNNVTLEAGNSILAWVDESRRVLPEKSENDSNESLMISEESRVSEDGSSRIAIENTSGETVGFKEWNPITHSYRYYDVKGRRTTEKMIQKILAVQN